MKAPDTSDNMSLNFLTISTLKLRYHVCVFSHRTSVFLYLENSNTGDSMSLKFPTISTLKLRYHVLLTDGNKCWEEKKYHFLAGKILNYSKLSQRLVTFAMY